MDMAGGAMAPPNPTSFDSTYAALQHHLFERQGCTEAVCHGSASAGGLNLMADVSYAELVEAPSVGSPMARVEPGDRNRSYLFHKLLASIEPESADINGGPMPPGGQTIPENLMTALRLWIYAGAPESGTVDGTAELLDVELPPVRPLTITPLPPPEPGDGFQVEMPPWNLGPNTEREVCFASYFDLRDQVPDAYKNEDGTAAFVRAEELRQDPQSHHLILNYSTVDVANIHDPLYGDWTCHGGEMAGAECEPTDLASCGVGHCATSPVDGFGCIGFGPVGAGGPGGSRFPIGGAQKAQDFDELPEGVYRQIPLQGILLWNSHAFNLTDEAHLMNGRINFLFADEARHRSRSLLRLGARNIFMPATPPFEREEICADMVLPQGAHVFSLTSHTHQRGERFTIFHPDGTLLYENLIFNDPLRKRFGPPLVFDAEDPAQRTLRYCAVYNNGVGADGTPDPETVTRRSRLPDSVNIPGVPGICAPVACAAGNIGAPCSGADDNAACDSAPGAGDGLCDACAITGGESTENEMFLLLGEYYLLEEGE